MILLQMLRLIRHVRQLFVADATWQRPLSMFKRHVLLQMGVRFEALLAKVTLQPLQRFRVVVDVVPFYPVVRHHFLAQFTPVCLGRMDRHVVILFRILQLVRRPRRLRVQLFDFGLRFGRGAVFVVVMLPLPVL